MILLLSCFPAFLIVKIGSTLERVMQIDGRDVNLNCILCGESAGEPFFVEGARTYHHCAECDLRFLDPAARVSPDLEKTRYLLHNNDVDDPAYRNFVRPLYEEIVRRAPAGAEGLDFGAGTGPVLAAMLTKAGYTVQLYDPFFHPVRACLGRTYDFVVACKVVEHFHYPAEEFRKLKELLGAGGILGLSTLLWDPSIEFARWHYRRDPTHTVFYSSGTFRWIARHFGFSDVSFSGARIVTLKA